MWKRTCIVAAAVYAAFGGAAQAEQPKNIGLSVLGTYETGVFDEGAAEIVAYDPATQRLFVINADAKTVEILDITDPATPTLDGTIVVSDDIDDAGGINSVAVHDGLVGVAVEHDDKQSNGWAAFYDTDGEYINHVGAGPLPDMITITHNGNYALVANEGEPSDDYTNDPEGSVTVIDLRNGAANASTDTADFTGFNAAPPAGVRYSMPTPTTTFAQDMEPEYIATSHDSRTAWVTLQENNAIAIVDIRSATVTDVVGLGNKDHLIPDNGLDASNEDGAINITNWPVLGTYMPDALAAYRTRGRTYLVTANEGDGREYAYDASEEDCLAAGHTYDDGDCFSWVDETRVKDVTLDPSVFMDSTLQDKPNLGRLKMLTTEGNTDDDDEYEEIHAFGARSISIWDAGVSLVADTGDTIEQETAVAVPDDFNSTNDENGSFDDRSDDKGPEPEGVVVGKVRGNHYAFVGLERVGGIMIFDVTDPANPRFVSYTNNRDFSGEAEAGTAGDLGPEGLVFIKPDDSPNGEPLLAVGNEVSGTTTIYQVTY